MEKSREEVIKDIATKHDVSVQTVATLLNGLQASGGNQVQFNISELGGMGQWQPGMVMVGDMFNNSLKTKVQQLCEELATVARSLPEEEKSSFASGITGSGSATFKGSQNSSHYAYYAAEKRLMIEHDGKRTFYDTTGYPLTGVQQSQSGIEKRLTFTYPGGTVWLNDLKTVQD
jgi:4-diphosphocytidyl-2C-methyl-D-erythritol kinase